MKRASQFFKRTLIPSHFMHEPILRTLGCYDEVKALLLKGRIHDFSFNALPSCFSLIIEFISSYTLRSFKYDDDNPYFFMCSNWVKKKDL